MTAPTEPDTCADGCYLPSQYRTRGRCQWCPELDRGPPAPEPASGRKPPASACKSAGQARGGGKP